MNVWNRLALKLQQPGFVQKWELEVFIFMCLFCTSVTRDSSLDILFNQLTSVSTESDQDQRILTENRFPWLLYGFIYFVHLCTQNKYQNYILVLRTCFSILQKPEKVHFIPPTECLPLTKWTFVNMLLVETWHNVGLGIWGFLIIVIW